MLIKACKKETLAQVFSCEFWGIFKKACFTDHLRSNASAFSFSLQFYLNRTLAGRASILKKISQWWLLYCTHTTRCYLSVSLYIQHLQKQPPEVFCKKKMFLKISQKTCNFLKKEILAQVFSCEFCEIPKNMFSTEPAAETSRRLLLHLLPHYHCVCC